MMSFQHSQTKTVGQTPTTPRTTRKKIPPIAGYAGFVPGLNSGNRHGRTWRNLFVPPREIADGVDGRPPEPFDATHP
eukprot:CAMPEP_0196732450 /NCGR_PEP_ID=MMETSP1091-20130531/11857_1 /TAXON_ID=302021 /ORGANISM="Rhodomonas sp., Strain CCMP768" /LENGTH=76 /DNA_ID=CAMNT_0042075721 /DNA_START=66 /DNA_END=293 /DNA_ORIENTATION=+